MNGGSNLFGRTFFVRVLLGRSVRRLWPRTRRHRIELAAAFALSPVLCLVLAAALMPLPAELRSEATSAETSTVFLDRHGATLCEVRASDGARARPVRLSEVGDRVVLAWLAAEAKRLTGGRGVDVVLDMVAGDYVGREIECLADDGRLAMIAVQGGTKSTIDSGLVLRKRLAITGSTLRPRSIAYKTELARALRDRAWPLIESGRIKPVIHQTFAATDASAAHALMESSTHVGKIVLTW